MIMKWTMRCLAGMALSATLFSQMGCVAAAVGAAAGAGAVVYLKGTLEETVSYSAPTVYRAAIAALQDLKVPILEDRHDNLNAELKAKFADNTHLWIWIDSVSSSATTLKIRVGTFGEENRSRQVLDAIHRHLSRKATANQPVQSKPVQNQPAQAEQKQAM
jgi:hypothetical protein